MLLFATLFIFGDKKVVHDVSRQEAGRNQAGARRGACLQCHRGTRPWNLSYPRTLSQPCGPCGSFFVFIQFYILEFKSNNNTSSCYATDEQKSLAAKEMESKRNNKRKKNHDRRVRQQDPVPVRRADSEQKPFVDLAMMA